MMPRRWKGIQTACAALFILLLLSGVAWAQKIHPKVEDELKGLPPAGKISVIVVLRDRTDLAAAVQKAGKGRGDRRRAVIEALRKKAADTQPSVLALLTRWKREGRVDRFNPFWIINGLEVTGTASVIRQLAAMPEVLTIEPNLVISVPPLTPAAGETPVATSEWNIAKIRAPEVWALGFQGQGTVVGGIDTGVLLTHPDLQSRWRGGSNSWRDVVNGRSTPYDDNGHGTHTIGTAVGGSASGKNIGVAPGAQWIACKFLRSNGSGTFFGAFLCMQWMLDPDGNPATDDAPDVVNNSWGSSIPGCFLIVVDAVRAWRAAGIVPVFAAGNAGPGAETGGTPAVYPESFAVGATDINDVIANFSSRGPSSCDGTIFPEVSAPGVSVKSAFNNGGYAIFRGTSMAAPHVAGAVALLRNVDPALTVADIENLLKSKAVDLGEAGPDNAYGFGRIDAFAAVSTIAPVIKVTPTEPTDFGTVPIGSFVDRTFTVENIGGGTLAGTATTATPFSVVSGGSYSLTAGQSAQVVVRFTPTASGAVTGSVSFTGGGGATRQVSGTGIRVNRPPVADAGGPYTVDEGGTVALAGSGSDPDGDLLTFEWDLDNNGIFETPGQNVTFSVAGLDGPSTRTVVLRVTDPEGLSATSEATVTINNVAPTVTSLTASPLIVNEGSPVTFSGSFTDPGTADTHTVSWDFGDGSSLSIPLVPPGSRNVIQGHTYQDNGLFTARLTITDDDGGSGMRDLQVQVQNVPPAFNPPLSNQTVDEGKSLNFMVRAVDPSLVDLLTLTAIGLPSGATFTVPEGVHQGSITGTFAWTPSCFQAGMYPVTFRATDDDGGVVQQTMTLTVTEACQAAIVAVTNRNDDTVSLIDAAESTVKATLSSGHKPLAAAFFDVFTEADSRAKLYVANRNDDTVTVYRQPALGTGSDPFALEQLTTVGVGQKPEGVAVTPDGRHVWVTNRNDDTLSILDRATDQPLVTVPLGKKASSGSSGKGPGAGPSATPGGSEKPVDIGFAPDGSRAYVTARNSNDLLVLDTEKALTDPDKAVIAMVPVGNKPVALAVSPSGQVIYVVNRSGNSVSVVDAASLTVLKTIPMGHEPEGVAVTPDGTKVYVTNSESNSVTVIRGEPSFEVLTEIQVGHHPAGVATTPAETGLQRAYVANREDDTVSVIDTASDQVIATIPVGKGPVGVAVGILKTR